MNISIRKSKHQKEPMTDNQFKFACKCVESYKSKGNNTYFNYEGSIYNEKMHCDIYTTKTQISAIVYKR